MSKKNKKKKSGWEEPSGRRKSWQKKKKSGDGYIYRSSRPDDQEYAEQLEERDKNFIRMNSWDKTKSLLELPDTAMAMQVSELVRDLGSMAQHRDGELYFDQKKEEMGLAEKEVLSSVFLFTDGVREAVKNPDLIKGYPNLGENGVVSMHPDGAFETSHTVANYQIAQKVLSSLVNGKTNIPDTAIYRSMLIDSMGVRNLESGMPITLKTFSSWTSDLNQALGQNPPESKQEKALFVIGDGINYGTDISKISKKPESQEVVLSGRITIQSVDHEKDEGYWKIEVDHSSVPEMHWKKQEEEEENADPPSATSMARLLNMHKMDFKKKIKNHKKTMETISKVADFPKDFLEQQKNYHKDVPDRSKARQAALLSMMMGKQLGDIASVVIESIPGELFQTDFSDALNLGDVAKGTASKIAGSYIGYRIGAFLGKVIGSKMGKLKKSLSFSGSGFVLSKSYHNPHPDLAENPDLLRGKIIDMLFEISSDDLEILSHFVGETGLDEEALKYHFSEELLASLGLHDK